MVIIEKVVINKKVLNELYDSFVAFDTETSGLNAFNDRIIELGAVLFKNCQVSEQFNTLVNPNIYIPYSVTMINHITNEMLKDAPNETQAYKDFTMFMKDVLNGKLIVCAHNATFDMNFLKNTLERLNYSGRIRYVDTLQLSRKYIKDVINHKQETIANYFNIVNENAHRAASDAMTCGKILTHLLFDIACDITKH